MSVQMIEINTMGDYIHFKNMYLIFISFADKIKIDMSSIGIYL